MASKKGIARLMNAAGQKASGLMAGAANIASVANVSNR